MNKKVNQQTKHLELKTKSVNCIMNKQINIRINVEMKNEQN